MRYVSMLWAVRSQIQGQLAPGFKYHKDNQAGNVNLLA
jgi:hypothetical protein